MKQEEEKSVGLPDNAFRPLKPGEQYHPIMSPNKKYPEVNLWYWVSPWRYYSRRPQLTWD